MTNDQLETFGDANECILQCQTEVSERLKTIRQHLCRAAATVDDPDALERIAAAYDLIGELDNASRKAAITTSKTYMDFWREHNQ